MESTNHEDTTAKELSWGRLCDLTVSASFPGHPCQKVVPAGLKEDLCQCPQSFPGTLPEDGVLMPKYIKLGKITRTISHQLPAQGW